MSFLFGQTPPMPAVAAVSPPPTPPSFANVAGAGAEQALRSKGGFLSTIATSSQGDLSPSRTAKKSLLGQ